MGAVSGRARWPPRPGRKGRPEEGKGDRKEASDGYRSEDDDEGRDAADLQKPFGIVETDPRLAAAFAAVDAANARAERTLADETRARPERDPLIYDPDWDEDGRLDHWRAVVDQTRSLPPTLAAAIATEAWDAIEPLEHTPWLGRLLAS